LYLIIALIVLAVLIWLRSYLTEPKTAAKLRKSDIERIMVWYRAALRLLIVSGRKPNIYHSPALLAQKYPLMAPLFDAAARAAYGNSAPSADEFSAAAIAYTQEWRRMKIRHRFKAWFDRMIHGTGNVKIVP
jgi:hypothetical protein